MAFLCFALGAFDNLTRGVWVLGSLQAVVALVNAVPLLTGDRYGRWTELVIHLCDVVVALATAASYYLAGTRGLHYAWLAAAATFVVLTVVQWRRGDG